MKSFTYLEPASLDEAVQILTKNPDKTKLLAGGTDLIRKMRKGTFTPEFLVNLKGIPELNRLAYDPVQGLYIGAAATIDEIACHSAVEQHYPILQEIAYGFATRQVRIVGTVGGNLCNASPAADYAPVLLALGAQLQIAGPNGERELPLCEFFVGNGQTALGKDEVLKAILLPPPGVTERVAFKRHITREMFEVTVASVCVWVNLSGNTVQAARIAIGSAASIPLCASRAEAAMVGQELNQQLAEKVLAVVKEDIRPISDYRASADYRNALVQIYLRRAIEQLIASA